MKRIVSILLALSFALVACFALTSCGEEEVALPYGDGETKELAPKGVVDLTADDITITGDVSAVKIGIILVGDENEGYTYAHMEGIKAAAAKLGIADNQIIWRYSVGEDQTCKDAADDLVDQGCKYVFSNSYGHQTYMLEAAKDHPEVGFVSLTGDTASSSGLTNFANAFTDVYECRYVSGVVAGLKLKALVEDGTLTKEKYASSFDADGNIKIGYVGAYPYAEVVSGYTAFYLGIKSVISNVVMEVMYTGSWFDIAKEGTTAEALIADGCVIIGQHADSTGAPAAVQAAYKNGKLAFSVGYNVSMLSVAEDVCLTSATNSWEVYYEYAFATAINNDAIATNWAAGFAKGAVALTELGKACAPGTAEYVAGVTSKIKSGEIKVFDTSKFTVGGKNLTWAYGTDTNGDFTYDSNNVISGGSYHESYTQSAPSFALRIDGITEK